MKAKVDPIELEGPMPPQVSRPIFQVTMPSGMIVTSPDGFGPTAEDEPSGSLIVTEDGRVLSGPRST